MAEFNELHDLIQREERAREQAEAASNTAARLAHLARADGYLEKINGLTRDGSA